MKSFFLITISTLITSIFSFAANKVHIQTLYQDSTLRQRFIVSLLQEYKEDGRWFFTTIDSCSIMKFHEVVKPITLFNSLSETNLNLDTKQFIFLASDPLLMKESEFSRCPEREVAYGIKHKYPIAGVKINMNRYKVLNEMPLQYLLNKYFNKETMLLKKQYKIMLYEIIAACYTKNVKVITPTNGVAYYEIFK